jgi:predicted component of type VI protein secretion system
MKQVEKPAKESKEVP